MQVHLDAIAGSIKRMPEGIELIALASGDEVTNLTSESDTSAKFYGFVADKIRRLNAEGGNVAGSCVTTTTASESGVCKVNWISSNPRPLDGRATIVATAIGEETFTDGLFPSQKRLPLI